MPNPTCRHSSCSPVALTRRALVAIVMTMTAVSALPAQGYPFSQRGSLTQSVALTDIRIEYGRPTARGRALFGQLVPWDSVWHPGADSATRITFAHDVLLDGHAVKAGAYSVWLVPRERLPWTFILSRAAHVSHKPYPGAGADALRFEVVPERLSYMETLAYYFSTVLRDEATMRIHWGELGVPVHIKAPYQDP